MVFPLAPPIRLGALTTEPRTLRVGVPRPGSPGQPDSDVFIEVEATPDTPYVQGEIVLTVRIFRAVDISGADSTGYTIVAADVGRYLSFCVTPGDGIEWAPAPLADGSIGLLRSDALMPARPALLDRDGRLRDLATETMPDDFPRNLVTPIPVEITATDGMKIPAQLFVPKGLKPGAKVPVAIFLHGGSRRQMLLGWHMRGYYHNAYGMSQYMASRGIMALALNYRSGIGYGLEFREAEDYGATGNSEFRDVIGTALYLAGRPDVDPERITV